MEIWLIIFTLSSLLVNCCEVIRTKRHFFVWKGDWVTVGRLEKIVIWHHELNCLFLCFFGKRNMDSHLVSVKVSIVTCTDTWVELNSSSFDKKRVKCLNT